MKRNTLAITLVAVAVLIVAAVAWASTVKIVVEGEDYASIKPSMAKESSTQAANGAYVHIPLKRPHATTESGPSDDGNCVYKVNIPAAGNYRLFARTNWYDGCGNSFFLIVDNKPSVVIGQDGTYQKWHWVPSRGLSLDLSAGVHTFRFQNREDGAKLDQFLLVNSSRYIPVNAEQRTPSYIIR